VTRYSMADEVVACYTMQEVVHNHSHHTPAVKKVTRLPDICRYLQIRNQVGESGADGLAKAGRRLSRGAAPSTSSSSSKEKTP
jgi:hypothetical protein